MLDQRSESAQGHELTFAVNHLGPYLLTELLLDQIRAAGHGRIVDVASVAHRYAVRGIRWDDLDRRERFNGWMVYAESKLANVLHTRELAARLEETDVVVHCLHPGNVATRFGRDGDLHGANDRLLWFAQYVLISPGTRRTDARAPGLITRCAAHERRLLGPPTPSSARSTGPRRCREHCDSAG